jgi:L-fucose mutarotase
MLKGIPSIISPELLKILMEMGHGDELCIGDGNFPGQSVNPRCVRCDGHGVPELLDAILQVCPLDTYAEKPVTLMNLLPGDVGRVETPIWDKYDEIIAKYDARGGEAVGHIDRFDFYDEAKKAYAVIATSEKAIYANIMLQKGII